MARWSVAGLISVTLAACGSPTGDVTLLKVGPGPEDLELGSVAGAPRLYTASCARDCPGKLFAGWRVERNLLWSFDPTDMRVVACADYEKTCDPMAVDFVAEPSQAPQRPLLYVLNRGCASKSRAGCGAQAASDESGGTGSGIGLYGKGVAVFDAATLVWTKDIVPACSEGKDPLVSPNSIAVTRTGTIYVSNFDSTCVGCSTRTPDIGLGGDDGPENDNIVMWRPKESGGLETWVPVARRVGGANGLLLSPDERYLFVSAWHSGKVWRLERDSNGHFKPLNRTLIFDGRDEEIKTCLDGVLHPDNLSFAPNGDLLVTGQVGVLSTALHLGLHNGISVKSAVVRVALASALADHPKVADLQRCSPELVETFNKVAAISEVVIHGKRRFLGQIIGEHIGVTGPAHVEGSDAMQLPSFSGGSCVDAASGNRP
jgi:hypothetical protein